MGKIPAIEEERITHINFVTNELHDVINELYEAMTDRDYDSVKTQVKAMQKQLKNIVESLEDD